MPGPVVTQVAESTPFDNDGNRYIGNNVQDALVEQVACEVYLNNFTNYIPNGYCCPVPFDSNNFETISTIHDPTVSDSGTATGTQTSSTLQDTSKSWTPNQFTNYIVRTTGGTGLNRWRKIASNTSNTLTLSNNWVVTPDATTTYEITQYSTRLTAPTEGIYLITGQIGYEKSNPTTTTWGLRFDLNGVFKNVVYRPGSTVTEHEINISKTFSLSANDYVEMFLYQNSGSEKKCYGSSRMFFSLTRLG